MEEERHINHANHAQELKEELVVGMPDRIVQPWAEVVHPQDTPQAKVARADHADCAMWCIVSTPCCNTRPQPCTQTILEVTSFSGCPLLRDAVP